MKSAIDDFTGFSDRLAACAETPLSGRYLEILLKWIAYGRSLFEPWPRRPRAGHFLGGVLWYCQETVMPSFAFAAAASSEAFDPSTAGIGRDEAREIALRGLRYACFTHDTGPADCVRPTKSWGRREPAGRKWGERGCGFFRETNAGRQAANLAATAYLIRDLLGDEEREMLATIARDFLERFLTYPIPSGLYHNTQMEENAWTSFGLTGAALLLEEADEFASWMTRIEQWMFHATTTPDDMWDFRAGPGGAPINRCVDQRFTTLPDFTAENHGFVHPSYMKSCINLIGQASVLLRLWDRAIPEAAFHHHRDILRVISRWCDDMGAPHAPQGMDWPYVNFTSLCQTHAMAAVNLELPDAALLERASLSRLETQIEVHRGRLIPAETQEHCHGQQDPAIMQERFISHVAYVYLLHRLASDGPAPSDATEFRKRIAGVEVYPHGGAAIHFHRAGRTSVSWRNGPMVLPATGDGLRTIGQTRGSLLAQVEVLDRPIDSRLLFRTVREAVDRLSCVFEERLYDGAIRRRVVFSSFPDGSCFVWERVTAAEPVSIDRVIQGRLSVMNDPVFAASSPPASQRTVYTAGGSRSFSGYAASAAEAVEEVFDLSGSPWLNVDDKFGIVFATSGRPRYRNPHHWKVWHAIEDWIELGGFEDRRSFKADQTICWTALLWLPETDRRATSVSRFDLIENDDERLCARIETPARTGYVVAHFGGEGWAPPLDRSDLHQSRLVFHNALSFTAPPPADGEPSIIVPPREPVSIEIVRRRDS